MAGRSVLMKLGRAMAVPEVEVVVSEAQGEDMEAAVDSVAEEVEVAEDMEATGAMGIGAMAAETEVMAATEAMVEETEAMAAAAADTGAAVAAVATPPAVATGIIGVMVVMGIVLREDPTGTDMTAMDNMTVDG